MSNGVIATIPRMQFSNALGIPLAGGKLITYLAGTTTLEPTYQDQALTIANPTSITLDSTGSCVLWLDPEKSYKFLLKNALGVTQPGWPVDNISGASSVASLAPTFSPYAKLSALAAATGAALLGFVQKGALAVKRTIQAKLEDTPTVFDYMTLAQIADVVTGTAAIDVTDACQAALDAHDDLKFPHGARYKLSRSLRPRDGATVRGGGQSPVYPYDAATYTGEFGTELRVTNFPAFDLTGLVGVTIEGFGIKAVGGGVSEYGQPANYVAGAAAAILTGSTLCRVRNVSFHGLEYGVAASPNVDEAEAAFWKIDDFTAQDCKTVIKMGNQNSVADIARDFTVSNCQIALHCNQMIDITHADGARIELCRFFQAHGDSVYIKDTPFVTMSGVTVFEAMGNNIVLDGCKDVVMSGVMVARAGGYTTATPWPAYHGIKLIDCTDCNINGVIERPSEVGLYLTGCGNIKADLSIVEPFFTNGMMSPGATLGAVTVLQSEYVNVDIIVSGDKYLYSIAADFFSSISLVGKVGGNSFCGVYRGYDLASSALTLVSELAEGQIQAIAAGGSVAIATKRVWVPGGKSLVSRSFHMTSPGVTLRVGANFWTAGLVAEGDGGNTSFEKKTIYTNNTGTDTYYSVVAQLYNPTAAAITVPTGHKTMVSFAIE